MCLPAILLLVLVSTPAPPDAWESERALGLAAAAGADYAGAEAHQREAVRLSRSVGGGDLRIWSSLTELAAVLQARGKYAEAEPLLTEALAVQVSRFGEGSIEAAFARNNLGAIYQQLGQMEKAQAQQGAALETAQRVLAPGDPALIPYLMHSGTLERALQNYPKAERLLDMALSLALSSPADGLRKARIVGHLANVYTSEKRYGDALTAYRRALEILGEAHGPEEMEKAVILSNMGNLLASRESYTDALPILEKAVATCTQPGIAASVVCGTALNNLTSVESALGDTSAAERNGQRALVTLEKLSGGRSALTAGALNNLGQTYLAEGRYREADELIGEALDILKATRGTRHPDYGAALGSKCSLYFLERKYKKAEPPCREALEIDGASADTGGVRLAKDWNRLAVLLYREKRYPEAESDLRRAIGIEETALGEGAPALADPVLNLAAVLQDERKGEEAANCYRRGIDLLTESGEKETGKMASVLDKYSDLLRGMELYADAEKASTEAMGIRVKRAIHGESSFR